MHVVVVEGNQNDEIFVNQSSWRSCLPSLTLLHPDVLFYYFHGINRNLKLSYFFFTCWHLNLEYFLSLFGCKLYEKRVYHSCSPDSKYLNNDLHTKDAQ